MTSSEKCQINVGLFFWHWRHSAQGICSTRTDSEWKKSTVKIWGDWGKSCGAYTQIMAQLLLGPEPWWGSGSCIVRCAAVFGFYEDDSPPPPSLITGPRPAICSYSQRWNWSWRGDVLTALKRSQPIKLQPDILKVNDRYPLHTVSRLFQLLWSEAKGNCHCG